MKYTNIHQKQQEQEIVQNKCDGKLCKIVILLGLIILIGTALRYIILHRLQIIRQGYEHQTKQSAHSLTHDINLNPQLKLKSSDNLSNSAIIDINGHNFSSERNNNKQSHHILNNSFINQQINQVAQSHVEKAKLHLNLQNNQHIKLQLNQAKQKNTSIKLQQKTKPVQKSTIKIDPQILNDAIEQSGKNQRAGISSKKVSLWKQFISLKSMPLSSDLAQQQKEYFQQKYNISHFPELPFCVVVPTFQNVANNRYLNNIKSILQQDYSNFHVVVIDDASRDGTGDVLQSFVRQFSISDQKLKIVFNEQRKMAMPNIYRAAKQFCKSYELFVIVDGDDEIIGKQVFKLFNSIFQSKDVWLVYSNFITGNGNIGFSRPYHQFIISNNGYRKGPFTTSHLRVFYTKLLTLVNENDLKNQKNEWFRAANDVAMYIPIMELCHKRLTYIPQISYLYNANTGLNNHKNKFKQQRNNQKLVRDRKSYSALEKLFNQQQIQKQNLDKNKRIQLRTNPKEGHNKFDWEE